MKIVAVSGIEDSEPPVKWLIWGLILGTTAAIFLGTLRKPRAAR
jgi:hypothetical protein